MILMLTKDLMMTSRVSHLARKNGVKFKSTKTGDRALVLTEELRPQILLIDLQVPELDVAQLGAGLLELADARSPLTIAYAQHIYGDLLQSANEARFDQVLTRGQFSAQLEQLVASVG